MRDLQIPDDLMRALADERSLRYDETRAQPGRVVLKSFEALEPRIVAVDSDGHPDRHHDPHAGERGHYAVPAVDLVAACDHYYPDGILLWLPGMGEYGTWDIDHWTLIALGATTWTDIERDPLPYLNALWAADPPGYLVAPWEHGFPFRPGHAN